MLVWGVKVNFFVYWLNLCKYKCPLQQVLHCCTLPLYFDAAPCTTGQVQLGGGNIPNEGRVEICMNNKWITVCGDTWGSTDATVVCRQLGYPTHGQKVTLQPKMQNKIKDPRKLHLKIRNK